MQDGKKKDSKVPLYGELENFTRKTRCPLLSFEDICKRDMKSAAINIESLGAYGQKSLHMAASRKRGNQACREYTKHETSEEEKYQKSHGHSTTT